MFFGRVYLHYDAIVISALNNMLRGIECNKMTIILFIAVYFEAQQEIDMVTGLVTYWFSTANNLPCLFLLCALKEKILHSNSASTGLMVFLWNSLLSDWRLGQSLGCGVVFSVWLIGLVVVGVHVLLQVVGVVTGDADGAHDCHRLAVFLATAGYTQHDEENQQKQSHGHTEECSDDNHGSRSGTETVIDGLIAQ